MSRYRQEREETGTATSTTDNSAGWEAMSGSLTVESDDQDPDQEWIALLNYIVGGSQTGYAGNNTRIVADGVELANSRTQYEPPFSGSSDGMAFQHVRRYTSLGAGLTANYEPSQRTAAAAVGRQAHMARGTLNFMRLDFMVENQDWFYADSAVELTALDDTAWVDGQSVTIGDGVSDYVVWTEALIDMNSISNDIRGRIFDGTAGFMEWAIEASDTSDVPAFGTMMYFAAPAKGTVITAQYRAETATAPSDIEFNSIFALRLDIFEDHAGVYDADVTSITVLDTDTIVQTLTHTTEHVGGADRWWQGWGACIVNEGDTRKRIDTKLQHSGGGYFTNGNTDRSACEAQTDKMPLQVNGATREPSGADLDWDLVLQEETNLGATDPACIESCMVGFTPYLKYRRGVRRITEWAFSVHPEADNTTSNGLDDNSSVGVVTPAAGATGNVTIGTGTNRLFLFCFQVEDGLQIDVSVMTVGGITATGNFKSHFATSGGQDLHCNYWWWDEAAIQSMTGLAIAWTDDGSWGVGDAQHTWATFDRVDQNDPVPAADQNATGTDNINPHPIATPCDRFKDWSVFASCTNETTSDVDRVGGMAIIFNQHVGAGQNTMAESNHADAIAEWETNTTTDTLVTSIRIKAAPIMPFYNRRENTLLRM